MSTVLLTGASGFLGGHLLHATARRGPYGARAVAPRGQRCRRSPRAAPCRCARQLETPACTARRSSRLRGGVSCRCRHQHVAAPCRRRRPRPMCSAPSTCCGRRRTPACRPSCIPRRCRRTRISCMGRLSETAPQRGGESWINYERSKYLGEQAVRQGALPWIVFNPAHILGPGDRHNWSRLIRMIDTQKLPGIPPGIGTFADVREIARAQVRAWQRRRFGECYLLGGAQASFVDFVHRVGAPARAPHAARRHAGMGGDGAWPASADAWSRVSGAEPDVTPEGATLTAHHLRVDSSKAIRELDYRGDATGRAARGHPGLDAQRRHVARLTTRATEHPCRGCATRQRRAEIRASCLQHAVRQYRRDRRIDQSHLDRHAMSVEHRQRLLIDTRDQRLDVPCGMRVATASESGPLSPSLSDIHAAETPRPATGSSTTSTSRLAWSL